jgi:glycosyltransferase involved in cell wall biosynthesis
MTPLRIALLHNIISPHVVPLFERIGQQPGVSLKVYFLAESDRNRRWSTSVDRSFQYEVLPNWALRVGRKDLYTFFVNPTVVSALRRDGFDVVVSVGWDSFAAMAAFAMCKILHKPFVLWSGSTANEPSWRRTLTLPLVRAIVRGSSTWIAYGSRARDYLAALGANRQHIAIAYNTVDVDWYTRESDHLRGQRDRIRKDLGLDDGPTVLYVGQLIERKGARDLLQAHQLLRARIPNANLLLAGYGPLEPVLRRDVAEQRIGGVHFVGHVAIPNLPRYYVASDCLALPSHEEVWGLVLNEAAASGLPLVTAEPVGAAPDIIIRGENGFVVPSGDPAALAVALQRAIEAKESMGAASRRIIAGMTYEQNVRAILEAVKHAVSPA